MARRIVIAVLSLMVIVLSAVSVPLGLVTANQDTHDFTDETVAAATTLANIAEERLDDGIAGPALGRSVRQLGAAGDQISVNDAAGRKVSGTKVPPPVSEAQLRRVTAARRSSVYRSDDRTIVIMPVLRDDSDGSVGTVVLARSTEPLDQRIATLWTVIAAVSAAGLAAAALVAIGLARWVNRPLGELEDAAQRLGDGDLGTRSAAAAGPSEVRRLAANFNLMAARLEALVHAHRATTADVSHQLRTPLAALRLRLDVLAEDSDEHTAAELAGAQEEIARLSRLVNGLLAVARAENVPATPVNLRLDEVITTRVAAWRPAAEEREVALRAEAEAAGVRMGEGQLEQILDNLIGNALDALAPGGTVQITASSAAGLARIVVADDGPGMSPQQRRMAFRRFASGADGGTGLGLAIVDRLVASNGGTAALSDSPGGGLTVVIELPLAPRDRPGRRGHV
ncbi:MAG TPA: HAMP domain-containing sensor histidine kinase [Streptosporangiaceae bacterium]